MQAQITSVSGDTNYQALKIVTNSAILDICSHERNVTNLMFSVFHAVYGL